MTNILEVSEVDFATIKERLKTFLNNQTHFTDHNFEGAGLNVLLDALAYSNHYHAVHSNLVFSETFLSSAEERNNVVSRAKDLGYIPRSSTAAKSIVNVSFSVQGNPLQYVIPKNTQFTASADNQSLIFVTTKDTIVNRGQNNIYSTTLDLYQGQFITRNYTRDSSQVNQKYIVSSQDCDTRFLTVGVRDTQSSPLMQTYSYIKNVSVGVLNKDFPVYFLKENIERMYEVYFGDGVIGKSLTNGNVISLTFLITSGMSGNGAKTFALSSNLQSVSNLTTTTLTPAFGGGERESVDSIKYLAPFYYASKGRAVTPDDYKSLIMQDYADIDDLVAWGGEDNIPPYYGKTFVAIKPKSTAFFSNTAKQSIQNDVVSKYNVLSIRPEIVDPDYINVMISTVITYNAARFDNTLLESDIRNTIINFFKSSTNRFGKPLYYSKLVTKIDETSDIILNSVTNLTLCKTLQIYQGISSTYTFSFNNALHPGAIRSNAFIIGGIEYKIMDIPQGSGPHATGVVAVYRNTQTGKIFLTRNAGTINYNTGKIVISNLKIDSIVGDPIGKRLEICVSPGAFANMNNPESVYSDFNVYTNKRDQIITLDESSIDITLLPDNAV